MGREHCDWADCAHQLDGRGKGCEEPFPAGSSGSEPDGAGNGSQPFSARDKSHVIGGWLPSLIIVLAAVVSVDSGASAGSSILGYVLTVTIPYLLLAIFLFLPYSKMKRGLWTASFAMLCLSEAYACYYLITHLPPEEWLMISGLVLLFVSQPVVIWFSHQSIPNQWEEPRRP